MTYVTTLCGVALVLGLGCFFFPNEHFMDGTMALLFTAALGALGAYIWSQRQLYGELRLTPNVIISSALFLWHLGFVGIYLAGLATDYRIIDYFEISPHGNIEGVAMVSTGIAAFIIGVTLGEKKCQFPPYRADPRAALLSALVLASGVALVCAYFAIKGRALIGEYQGAFVEADSQRRTYNFGLMLAIVGLAPAIFFSSAPPILISAMGGAAVVGAVAALMGTRWIFLVLLALVLSSLQFRGHRISFAMIFVLGTVCLFGSIVVKERRAGNPITAKTIGDYFGGRYTNPAVEFFEETGQALIACIYSADEFRAAKKWEWGKTFAQAFRSVFPGAGAELRADSPMLATGQALYPVRFANEGFNTGYSVFAEWFINFGIGGVALGSALMGYGLGTAWRRACFQGDYGWTALSYALAGYLTFGFRNDAMTWLRFVAWSTAVVAVLSWVEKATRQSPSTEAHSRG